MRIRQELLAAHFGASRIPVREALKQLENEGLVVLAPNRGAWIADVNSEESIEVYKIREVVEPLAIFESVPNLTDADIDSLDATVRELENRHDARRIHPARPCISPAHLFAGANAATPRRWSSDSGTARSISGGSSCTRRSPRTVCPSPIRSTFCSWTRYAAATRKRRRFWCVCTSGAPAS